MKQKHTTEEFLAAYDEFSDALFRHCYFRTSNSELARDLVQEVFVRTWKYIAEGKEIGHMRGFLYRVANNLIVDEFRKKKFTNTSLDLLQEKGFDPGKDEREQLMRALESKEILPMLEELAVQYRDVIVMRYLDELSPREIADALGESENAVSVRIHRGMKQLREILKEKGHEA